MEEKKNWKERLGGYDSMEEAMFVTIDEKTVYAIDELKEFIQQELDRAREEGVKMGMENAWEMVSALLDTLDINKNEEEIRILTGINKLFDREITKLALKLKNNK